MSLPQLLTEQIQIIKKRLMMANLNWLNVNLVKTIQILSLFIRLYIKNLYALVDLLVAKLGVLDPDLEYFSANYIFNLRVILPF